MSGFSWSRSSQGVPGSGTTKWHLYSCRILIYAINAELRRSWRCPFSINRELAPLPAHSVGEVASPIPHMRQRHPALGAIFALFSFGDFRSSFSFFGPSQVSVQSLNIQWPRRPRETRSSFFCSWESLALEVWSSTSAGSPATIGRSTPGFTGTGSTHTCVAVAETSASYPHNADGKSTEGSRSELKRQRRNQSLLQNGRHCLKTHTESSGPFMSQAYSEACGPFFAQPHFGQSSLFLLDSVARHRERH
jgi:hypothetical protein